MQANKDNPSIRAKFWTSKERARQTELMTALRLETTGGGEIEGRDRSVTGKGRGVRDGGVAIQTVGVATQTPRQIFLTTTASCQ